MYSFYWLLAIRSILFRTALTSALKLSMRSILEVNLIFFSLEAGVLLVTWRVVEGRGTEGVEPTFGVGV